MAPDKNQHNTNDLIQLSDKISNSLLAVIHEYFTQVSIKYKLPELDDILNYTYRTIESELEVDEGFHVFLIEEDETREEEKEKKELIGKDELTRQFSREVLFGEDRLPASIKEQLDVVDYLLVKSFYLITDEDQISLVFLHLQEALTMKPDHPVALLFYNHIWSEEEMDVNYFLAATAKAPFHFHISSRSFSYLSIMISALYRLIAPGEHLGKHEVKQFLSFFDDNEIRLFELFKSLSFRYSPQNMLDIIHIVMNKNPLENELQVLYVWILFDLQQYDQAYALAQKQRDCFFYMNRDDFVRHNRIYAELLDKQNQSGKAFIELKSIVDDEDYRGMLSDDYFEACLLLIEFYHQKRDFQNSHSILTEILEEHEEYMVECYGHRYFSLKADMFLGMQKWEEAISWLQKAKSVEENNG